MIILLVNQALNFVKIYYGHYNRCKPYLVMEKETEANTSEFSS